MSKCAAEENGKYEPCIQNPWLLRDCLSSERRITSLTASELKTGHCEDGAVHVPLALAWLDAGVDADRVVVALVPHQLHAAIVQADGQNWTVGLSKALDPVIPLHTDNLAGT